MPIFRKKECTHQLRWLSVGLLPWTSEGWMLLPTTGNTLVTWLLILHCTSMKELTLTSIPQPFIKGEHAVKQEESSRKEHSLPQHLSGTLCFLTSLWRMNTQSWNLHLFSLQSIRTDCITSSSKPNIPVAAWGKSLVWLSWETATQPMEWVRRLTRWLTCHYVSVFLSIFFKLSINLRIERPRIVVKPKLHHHAAFGCSV